MANAKAAASRAISLLMFASSHSRNAKSRIKPYLMTSASPADNSRSGRVFNVPVSARTKRGCQKAPIMFLPRGWLIPVLPADRRIHLSQQCCRYLDEWNSTLIGCGSKPSQISDHTTSQCDDRRRPITAFGQQLIVNEIQRFPVFISFTVRQYDRRRANADFLQGFPESFQIYRRNHVITDDRNPASESLSIWLTAPAYQSRSDMDWIAPRA